MYRNGGMAYINVLECFVMFNMDLQEKPSYMNPIQRNPDGTSVHSVGTSVSGIPSS